MEALKGSLGKMGIDASAAIKKGRLIIDDGYTATLTGGRIDAEPGKMQARQQIEEGWLMRSLKISDMSLDW